MGEVKNKLIMKAIEKYDLLNSHMKSDNEGAPNGPIKIGSALHDSNTDMFNFSVSDGPQSSETQSGDNPMDH